MEENYEGLTLDAMMGNLDYISSLSVEEAVIPDAPITPEAIEEIRRNPPYVLDMKRKIEEMDIYAHNRGSMGLDWGFHSLNKAFNGLNPGLHLVGGGANTGRDLTKKDNDC